MKKPILALLLCALCAGCSGCYSTAVQDMIDRGGYLGIKPKVGEEVRFCLINKTGKVRTNAPGVTWK